MPLVGFSFARGPNWLLWLLDEAPDNTLSYNFAIGGTQVSTGAGAFPYQVSQFMPVANRASSHYVPFAQTDRHLFIVWFGVNDIFFTVNSATPDLQVVDSTMNSWFKTVETLRQAGARHFLFIGSPRK